MLGQLLKEYPGKVRIAHKDLPLPSHKGAIPAAEAARCAGAQGVFWEYHDLLYLSAPDFSREDLIRYADRLSLKREPFIRCLDGREFAKEVEADFQEAKKLGVRGTPTFLVNGKRLLGAQPIGAFREAIAEAMNGAAAK